MGNGTVALAADEVPYTEMLSQLKEKFTGMMHALHREQGATLRIEILADKPVQDFINTHAAILDQALPPSADTPDASAKGTTVSDDMRQRLSRSNYIFSGIKTFHELNEAFPSLTDENGNRKPFERFLNDVQNIDKTYNQNYLRAEFNFVHTSADMAAKWEQFEADGDRYLLQYRTAKDDRVRPEHADLDGVTLPADDPFWAEFYPPNGWNCRCTVVQVRRGKYPVTPHDEAMSRGESALQLDKRGIFRFNPGLQQKTFPDYNPYTISQCRNCAVAKGNDPSGPLSLSRPSIPLTDLCQACQLLRICQEERQSRFREYLRYLNDSDYRDTEYHEKSGGIKATHVGHTFDDKKGWYEKKAQIAGFINGHSVVLDVEHHDIYHHRNTEGLWDGLLFEIAGAETGTANNIRNALKHCAKKPDSRIAVLFFPNDNFSTEEFNKGYSKYIGLKGTPQYKKFDLIYCIRGDKDEASVPQIIHRKKPSD